MPKLSHAWVDMSYHGSPTWECDHCGVGLSSTNSVEECDKTTKAAEEVAAKLLASERREYDRIRYLLDKFGGA